MAMAEARMPASWILRLIAVGLLLSSVCCNDNWNQQFTEIKTMITLLDSKISTMDTRLGSLNVLDYAFKMNTVDNTMMMLNTRVDQIASQIDSIKESLRNLPSSPCTDPVRTQEKRKQYHQNGTSERAGNVVQKLDDYGKKILQSQRDLQTSTEDHQRALSGVLDVIKNGFTKLLGKIESLLSVEGQMTTAISLIRQLAASSDFVRDEIAHLISDIIVVNRSVFGILDTSAYLAQAVTDVKNSISFPVNQLDHAIEMGRGIRLEMSRLTKLEKKIIRASALSSRLFYPKGLRTPSEQLQNNSMELSRDEQLRRVTVHLKNVVTEIENMTLPLFMSLPYNFEKMQILLRDAFISIADRTQCRSDHAIVSEIRNFKELFFRQGSCKNQAQSSDPNISGRTGCTPSLVELNCSRLMVKLAEIQSDMTEFVEQCKELPSEKQQPRKRTQDTNKHRKTAGTDNNRNSQRPTRKRAV